jgi:hypothetical protein
MSDNAHSWMEVRQRDLVRTLRKLARMPKPPKKARKLILGLEDGECYASSGLVAIRTDATGQWPVPAVLHFQSLDVLISLVAAAPEEAPIRLEGVGEYLCLGKAKLPCSFQNPAINLQFIDHAEREKQRTNEEKAVWGEISRSTDLNVTWFLSELRKSHPDCRLMTPAERTLVWMPAVPRLLLDLTPYHVTFRVRTKSGDDPDSWYTSSRAWKKFTYPMLRESGVPAVLDWAAKAAADLELT